MTNTWPSWQDPWVLAVSAGVLAQLLKLVLYSVANRSIALRVLGSTNGLPSSYAVAFMSLATLVGMREGYRSAEYAACMMLGGIVLHDIVRVQGSVDRGGRAALLLAQQFGPDRGNLWTGQLRPLLGDRAHRPLHVVIGMILGLVFALAVG
jgi:uncharacterized protein